MGSTCSELFRKSPCFKAQIKTNDQKIISTLHLTNLCRRYQDKKDIKTMVKPNVIWVLNKPYFPSNGLWVQNISMENGTYTGELVNSKKHGIGTFYWNDGKLYIGQWEKNIQCGIWENEIREE